VVRTVQYISGIEYPTYPQFADRSQDAADVRALAGVEAG
jgi:glyceraldehyde 3-phosphate dehydrogenase